MTALPEPAPGPPCDLCSDEEAVASVMQLATWETTRVGVSCLPEFFRSIAAAIDGAGAAPEYDAVNGPVDDSDIPGPEEAAQGVKQLPGVDEIRAQLPPDDLALIQSGATLDPGGTITLPSGAVIGADLWELLGGAITGSQSEHWAATSKVVRSTHGHRKGKPAADDE